jgi:ketosteroid isomerase-like protein
MSIEQTTLATLLAKEEIRELAMLYSRGVDRKDIELLRALYARDATDHHGKYFSGGAEDYLRFLEKSFPHMRMSGHFICNHLVSVDGDEGEGEIYALAYHVIPDRNGGYVEDFKAVRYIDRYRKENGRWKFARRVVTRWRGSRWRTYKTDPFSSAVNTTVRPSTDSCRCRAAMR